MKKTKATPLVDVDPVDEIRRIRDEHAKSFGYDADAIFADLKAFEKKLAKKTVSRAPKRGNGKKAS